MLGNTCPHCGRQGNITTDGTCPFCERKIQSVSHKDDPVPTQKSHPVSHFWIKICVGIVIVLAAETFVFLYWIQLQSRHWPSALPTCKANMKNIATGLEMYADDHEGRFPERLESLTPAYMKSIPTCSNARGDSYSPSYMVSADGHAFTFWCDGENHKDSGLKENYPQYTSTRGLETGE